MRCPTIFSFVPAGTTTFSPTRTYATLPGLTEGGAASEGADIVVHFRRTRRRHARGVVVAPVEWHRDPSVAIERALRGVSGG